jgi:2-keto-4-pentenoate hydratase/2-oxohepta-3-ene-1,7-dioic acid hydratase in catechol pathway
MRLVRFVDERGRVQLGAPSGADRVRPMLSEAAGVRTFADEAVVIRRYLPPVDPPNIFGIGRNYRGHVAETGARLPEAPLIFQKPTTALSAHGAAIVLPAVAPDEVDYEAELAIVIGRAARNVAPAEALHYVAGYTCANDVTARDCQRQDKQWVRSKGFDTFCPLGPYLVPADEVDPDRLRIRSRLNGRIMQDANTAEMIHSGAALVSYLSRQFTLLPDTVILTGTPDGVGFVRQPPVYLRAGDRIEVEIEGVGTLVNVVAGPEPSGAA